MNQAKMAWGAFKNMLRQAARDPIWAIVNIALSPIHAVYYFYRIGLGFIVIAFALYLIPYLAIPQTWVASRWIAGAVVTVILMIFAFRLLTNPMIQRFGDIEGETHGSARFATSKETAALASAGSGLLIGRDPKIKKAATL